MGRKKKIIRLNDEEYKAYIMSLKNDAALYNADGEMFVPDELADFVDIDKNP